MMMSLTGEQVFAIVAGMADGGVDHTTDGGEVVSALQAVTALDVTVAGRAELEAALASAGRVQGWLDAFVLRSPAAWRRWRRSPRR